MNPNSRVWIKAFIVLVVILICSCNLPGSGSTGQEESQLQTVEAFSTAVAGQPSATAILELTATPLPSSPAPPSGVNPPAPAQPVSEPYVDRVVSFTPGNPSNPQFSSTDAALGPPDFNASNLSGFVNLGVGGSITLEFVDIVAVDGPGDDISIFGDPQNDEMWTIEVSEDGANFKSFGKLSEVMSVDLAAVGLSQARFVRITDDGGYGGSGVSPGAELDAVMALNSTSSESSNILVKIVSPLTLHRQQ